MIIFSTYTKDSENSTPCENGGENGTAESTDKCEDVVENSLSTSDSNVSPAVASCNGSETSNFTNGHHHCSQEELLLSKKDLFNGHHQSDSPNGIIVSTKVQVSFRRLTAIHAMTKTFPFFFW